MTYHVRKDTPTYQIHIEDGDKKKYTVAESFTNRERTEKKNWIYIIILRNKKTKDWPIYFLENVTRSSFLLCLIISCEGRVIHGLTGCRGLEA